MGVGWGMECLCSPLSILFPSLQEYVLGSGEAQQGKESQFLQDSQTSSLWGIEASLWHPRLKVFPLLAWCSEMRASPAFLPHPSTQDEVGWGLEWVRDPTSELGREAALSET